MYYAVYISGKAPPTKIHNDEQEAKDEVEKLARQYPGLRVYLFTANTSCIVENPPVMWRRELPEKGM